MAGGFEGRSSAHRGVEQAIVALKKGAHLLKCGKRGKPKFCPFRLSSDEKILIWYSKEKEKHLSLSSVSSVVLGQKTTKLLRQRWPEKESQSLSLIYKNGECSLDLICKDKEQAESWYLGLTALISAPCNPGPLVDSRSSRQINSCTNSPPSYIQRKSRLPAVHDTTKFTQVRSLYGSPRFKQNRFLESNLDCSEAFFSPRQRTWSDLDSYLEKIAPQVLHRVKNGLKDMTVANKIKEQRITQVPKLKPFDQGSHAAEKSDSLKDIFIWGDFLGGMLDGGDGSKANVSLPRLLDSTQMLDVQNIACGEKHAAIVTKQGEVFSWGEESGGRLGHKVSINVLCPKIVESLTSTHVKAIAFGAKHTCAVTVSGELYEWGEGTHNLGLSDDQSQRSQWIPHKLFGPLDGICVSKIACGEWHTAIISSSGQLFTYGDGTFGVLGHGNTQSISRPKEVESLKGLRVKSVACGPWHAAAIVETIGSYKSNAPGGKLFTWGDTDRGKLGHADKKLKLLPTCVESLVDCDFAQVSCGTSLTVALTITGVVFTIGSSLHGQLGNPRSEDASISTVEGLLKTEFVREIASGSSHVAVLTMNGKVFTWGKGMDGQLGLGDYADRSSPTLVEALEDRHVESIACGSNFTTAICLHKSISSKDQCVCSGCRMAFGFTRKKHNCYNCGSVFCNSCSSNKVAKAALAPDKSKRYRVCDACFSQLQKVVEPSKVNSELKTDKEETILTDTKVYTPKLSRMFKEANFIIEKMASAQGANQRNQDLAVPIQVRTQRWGQVECPTQFRCARENILCHPNSKNQILDISHAPRMHDPVVAKSASSLQPANDALKEELDLMEKILSEEVKQLHVQVTVLAEQCQRKSLKVQLYKRKVEETWLTVRDEAAKCKAAKDIIKVLTNQRNALSEELSAGRHSDNSKITPSSISGQPAKAELPDPPDKKLVAGKLHQLDNVRGHHSRQVDTESTPSSNAIVPVDGSFTRQNHTRTLNGGGHIGGADAAIAPIESNSVNEQIERGVYVTFISLPGGKKGIKRVRFSRKHFGEKEAEKWWEENQSRVFAKYSIEQTATSYPNR